MEVAIYIVGQCEHLLLPEFEELYLHVWVPVECVDSHLHFVCRGREFVSFPCAVADQLDAVEIVVVVPRQRDCVEYRRCVASWVREHHVCQPVFQAE